MQRIMQKLITLSPPASLLILAYLGLIYKGNLPAMLVNLLPFLPYLLLLLTCLLAYRFNQSRIFYLALALIAIQFILQKMVMLSPFSRRDLVYSLIALLVPFTILVFSFLKERGIFSLWGFFKLGFLLVQFLAAAWMVFYGVKIQSILYTPILPWNFPAWPGIAQLCFIVFGIVLITFILRICLNNDYFVSAGIGILLSLFIIIHNREIPSVTPLFISSAALMMIICILQNTYSMAYLDELTEIPGRRALREELMKLSGTYSIAMVDIDFFKKFNDKYGHDVGDDVLRMVASKLAMVTGGGKAFRYGGEEFTIVFAGKKLTEVLPHLEKVRETIARSEFAIRGSDRPKKKPDKPKPTKPAKAVKKVSVTVSIGAAERNSRGKPQEIMKEADQALYRAKKKGRNCVCK